MSMNIYAKCDDKVMFNHPDNGYTPDQETAKKHLELGHVYTVDYTLVGSWHTTVVLQEFPNVMFNSVMFDDAPKSKLRLVFEKLES